MPYVAEFLAIALAHALAVMSPGPDFALVLRQSLVLGRGPAVWAAVGIGSGILMHVGYSLLGVGLLVRTSDTLFLALKLGGAGYLAWLGYLSLRSRPREAMATTSGRPPVVKTMTVGAAWRRGFLTNLLNPKATLFFIALFSLGINPATPRWVQAGYGLWMALATAAWFTLVAVVFARERVRSAFVRGGHWIDRAMGVVFLGFAASLWWN
jgi:RhtB (resistance to homoserine/threonine) family protein